MRGFDVELDALWGPNFHLQYIIVLAVEKHLNVVVGDGND